MSILLLVAACTPDRTPAWAYDPLWIEPVDGDALHGFETWQLYGPSWPKHYNDKFYACSVVVELDGEPIECDAEPGCTHAWEVVGEVAQSDCDAGLAGDPLFLSLGRVAIGGLDTGPDVAWPGQTSVGWADYGNGWEVHGEAYPEGLDLEQAVQSNAWDGEQAFLFVPASAFSLAAQ
jgi:hypothetical protein